MKFLRNNLSVILVLIFATATAGAAGSFFQSLNINQYLAIGKTTAADSSAALEVVSTTKGILPPKMTEAQRNAISSPATGLVIYNTDTDKLNVYDGSSWGEIGGGGGVGTKNYLTNMLASTAGGVTNSGNGDFELGSTFGWALGTTGTLTNGLPTGTPSFGSGASGNLSISAVTSGQLAGTASLSYASSAATTAGNMVASDAFYIDAQDQAKVLTFKLYYKAQTNPSNGNWSGTSSNSFGVAIYDVTNSSWLPPTGAFGMTQSSGIGFVSGNFQTSTNTSQLRLVIYNANASAGSITVYFDDIFVGPQTVVQGTPFSDWISYIPVFGATTTAPTQGSGAIKNAFWRRVGDSMEIMVQYQQTSAGTAGSGAYLIPLPSGYAGDTAKATIPTTLPTATVPGGGGTELGTATMFNTTAGNSASWGLGKVYLYNSTNMFVSGTAGGANQAFPFSSSRDVNFGSNPMYFTLTAKIPIAGWSSNVQMSSDTETRVVAARIVGTPASATAGNPIIFPTVSYDTHAAYNATTGGYTAPVSGIYRLSVSAGASAPVSFLVYVNGVSQGVEFVYLDTALSSGSFTVKVNAGDIIDIRTNGSTGAFSANRNVFSIERISGPSTIAASETVFARIVGTLPTFGTDAPLIYPTVDIDTHAAYNTSTGRYSCPITGFYRITTAIDISASPRFYIWRNGSKGTYSCGRIASNIGLVSCTTRCNAGDIIDLRADGGSGGISYSHEITFERIK